MTAMRMVASDLDGTVVRPDGTISPRTLAALAACVERDVDVVFVTGRPTRWMAPIARATGHRGLAVCGNGAVVYDLGAERVVRTRTLDADAVRTVVHRLRAVMPEAAFALETADGYRREPGFRIRHEPVDGVLTAGLEELLADGPDVVKVLCRDETSTADPMLLLARAELAGVAEPVHSGALGCMIEISASGVSKASTLEELARDRGVGAADVVAFGDMPNDVPMLLWAGRSFAMADGHPEAIEAADALAPPCEQDGVARVLEALLLELPHDMPDAGRPA
jgi:hypothetical protein